MLHSFLEDAMTITILSIMLLVTLTYLAITRIAAERLATNFHQQKVSFFLR